MASQEKLDAIYKWERARRDENLIGKATNAFLEGAKKAAAQGEAEEYSHAFSRVAFETVLPEVVRRLAADGYRVRLEKKSLVITFEPAPATVAEGWFSRMLKSKQPQRQLRMVCYHDVTTLP